jgi:hypothetical protein
MKRILALIVLAAVAYVVFYVVYRGGHREVWSGDGKTYVILGSKITWYAFRPLSYVDARATGMRFHLGPHRDTPQTVLDRAIVAAGGADRLAAMRAFAWRGRADASVAEKELHLTGEWRLQLPDSVVVTTTLEGQPRSSARSLIIAGPRGWTKVGSTIAPLDAEQLAHERDQFYLYYLMRLVPLRGTGYRLSRLEDDSAGRPRIRVARNGRPDVDLSFDSGGNLVGLSDSITDPRSHARVRQDVVLSGQLQAAGVRWPRRITITWDRKPYFDLEILAFSPLTQLVDPLLQGPAAIPPRRPAPGRTRKH